MQVQEIIRKQLWVLLVPSRITAMLMFMFYTKYPNGMQCVCEEAMTHGNRLLTGSTDVGDESMARREKMLMRRSHSSLESKCWPHMFSHFGQ